MRTHSKQEFSLWKVHNQRPMSTALLYCGTPEGFVIGADGRGFDLLTEQKYDTERKIFAFENPSASIVFAWAGVVKARLVSDSVFSLVDRTYDLLAELDYDRNVVPQLMAQLKRDLRMLGTNEVGECARGVFLSYKAGQPYGFEISVFKNGRTWDCSIDGEGEPTGEIVIVSGPNAEFYKPASLGEVQGLIKAYLDDCVAHPTDLIGGHVHIGKFTHEGFRWVRPPK